MSHVSIKLFHPGGQIVSFGGQVVLCGASSLDKGHVVLCRSK